MSFEIKRLSEENSAAIAEIEKLCFSHPWSEATVASEIKSGFADFFGAFCGEELVGYIGGRTIAGETEIFNVAVSPEFRRKGIAKALIEKFVETVREKGYDLFSIVADPLFKDPANRDFTLDENSPAFKLGIKPIDLSTVGVRAEADRD